MNECASQPCLNGTKLLLLAAADAAAATQSRRNRGFRRFNEPWPRAPGAPK